MPDVAIHRFGGRFNCGPYKRPDFSTREKEMRDGKLLSNNEIESAELRGQTAFGIQSTTRTGKRVNIWAIIGFCAVGLIGSLLVRSSYLHFEQTTTLLAEAPLS
jgi:hypothetical protein